MTSPRRWEASLGALPDGDGARFRVWAPEASSVEVVPGGQEPSFPLEKGDEGHFTGRSNRIRTGDRYRYRVDGRGPFPDPASRFQPEGVHGPSEVIAPGRFSWSHPDWPGVSPEDLVIYELHLGTFTPEGTYAAAAARLRHVADLGATAIELMPVADFPGRRGWGYDGVDLFAPARCYGRPDDLRRLVDEAHGLGLAVLLDVVYNHLGPDGNYLAQFSPSYFSQTHGSPWGPAINLDGPNSAPVRDFFVENALHWIHEYRMDGLRLDATHHLHDDSPRHLLAELSARVRGSIGRPIHLIAEDPRNLAHLIQPEGAGGWGMDGVWSDDFHHELRRYLVGDSDGVFRDFRGSLADLARTLERGWLFTGAYSIHRGYHRGTDPAGLPPRRFVFNIQNHDRIGNRARGERLNHQVDLATYRAATALLLTSAATPLLFMGQEWAAGTPFLFFTDHDEELGRKVREGRRREFLTYAEFADEANYALLPDIQADSTFRACKLDWSEPEAEPHASTLRLYRALLRLRREEPALRSNRCGGLHAEPIGEEAMLLRHDPGEGRSLALVARLKGTGAVPVPALAGEDQPRWTVLLTTEDPPFAPDPMPPRIDVGGPGPTIQFDRPGAVLLAAES
ncbi:Malto-oligosyltrehalose trehalohydrolase [Aquisphaera giovannonii]|uniref:Malto-oligosyltrehalose trehalohydrolase n=1 Tax=Aquisphaera giovannonii TaxID=406548 RepID=A0A5B9W217_9BACT|nr:malto-oligosyltrehalose trehalohydrolase [Aquisphaera giovannonii]QEH34646.1 Malto-oligosyltrehalose trehalohydrolase [Aquisphaera giovannonii]